MICFQDFTILCWNVRGVVNAAGRRHSRDLVKKNNPSMIILMETHCAFSRAERFWTRMGYEAAAYSEAHGHSGGIWMLMAMGSNYDISVVDCWHQMVTISIKKGTQTWWCFAIYASPTPSVRDLLWDHICSLRVTVTGPWLLLGDYNKILLPSEVRGSTFSHTKAQTMDLGSTGLFFTWVRRAHGEPTISKRLDRALADCSWRTHFPEAYVETLFRHHSDHSPLLL